MYAQEKNGTRKSNNLVFSTFNVSRSSESQAITEESAVSARRYVSAQVLSGTLRDSINDRVAGADLVINFHILYSFTSCDWS